MIIIVYSFFFKNSLFLLVPFCIQFRRKEKQRKHEDSKLYFIKSTFLQIDLLIQIARKVFLITTTKYFKKDISSIEQYF